jgi:hypothetical protein
MFWTTFRACIPLKADWILAAASWTSGSSKSGFVSSSVLDPESESEQKNKIKHYAIVSVIGFSCVFKQKDKPGLLWRELIKN